MKASLQATLLVLTFIFFSTHSFAAKYYFSTSSGDDSRSAAQAQNPDTPWKSVSKLNSIFRSLKPGDEILLKRGDVFYGTINISRSGTSSSPIVIGAYGSGPKPVITSLVKLSDWKSVGNGVYESSDKSLKKSLNVVLINQEIQEEGRFPNRDESNGGYLRITSYSGNHSVTSKELSSTPNFSGGEVVIRKNQWIIDRHKISNHSGNKINYAGTGSYRPGEGYGMFIQGHRNTLDQFGEWYYEENKGRLYVHFGSSSPNSNVVQASTADYLVTKSYAASHLRIENLHFNGANRDAIHLAGGTNVRIVNVDVDNSGENGMTMMSISNLVVDNSKISRSLNNGINLRYGNEGAKITNNVVENTFIFPGGIQNGDKNGVGILVTSNNSLVEYNQVLNTGFNGISFEGNGTNIKNNVIDGYGFFKNDGGGIYSYGGTGIFTVLKNRKITGNIILNGIATKDGIPESSVTVQPHASGIFLDDNSNGIEVVGNTIGTSVYSGIKIANSSNITVRDNTFYDSDFQVLVGNSSARGRNTRDLKFNNNIFYAKDPDQMAYVVRTDYNDVSSLGSFDQNYFARPFGDNYMVSVSAKKGNKQTDEILNLKRWQNSFNKDNNSKALNHKAKTFEVQKLLGKNLYPNGSFDSNVNDIFCSGCQTSWVSDKLEKGAIKVESPGYSSARFEVGPTKKNKNYILKFKGLSNKSGGLRIYLRYAGAPWELISPSTTVELNNVAEEYTVLLSPYEDVESTAVMLVSDEGNWTYWMDDIEFREAEVKVFQPKDRILFEYNPTKGEKTISLNGTYVDAKNRTYSGKMTLPPFSSVVLLNINDKVTEVPTEKPSVALVDPDGASEYVEGSEVVLKAEASAPAGKVVKVEFFSNGKLLGSATKAPFSYKWKSLPLGKHTVTAKVIDSNDLQAASEEVKVEVKSKPALESPKPDDLEDKNSGGGSFVQVPLYVNTGSAQSVTYEGAVFVPLSNTNISASNYTRSGHVGKNVNELFQTSSYGRQLTYSVPLPDGKYTVKTYHSESYFGEAGPDAVAGQRVFDIVIEGELMKDDFDMFTKSGNNEVVLVFENVEVKDGKLDIEMIASANNAVISGFSILPSESEPAKGINLEDALFINTGSLFDVIYDGNRFVSDYKVGSFTRSDMNVDLKASSEPLFQSYRFAKDLKYAIPVPNGLYTVITYHLENYYGRNGRSSRPGQRVFDIKIEGRQVKSKFDLLAEKGNEETFLVFDEMEVKDGVLNLDMTASSNNAIISGIAIIPLDESERSGGESMKKAHEQEQALFLINAGSYEDAEHDGATYQSEFVEGYFSGTSNFTENKNASSAPLYQSYRFGSVLNYSIPVENGVYSVVTHHHEPYFGHGRIAGGPNMRVFDVQLEDSVVKTGFDLYKESSNEPVALQFNDIVVTDGVLDIRLLASVDNAIISGIEIWSGSGKKELDGSNLRLSTQASSDTTSIDEKQVGAEISAIKLYPNPAKDEVTLTVHQEVGDFGILIHNMNGQLAGQYDASHLRTSDGNYLIPVHQLTKGVYLVTLAGKKEIIQRLRLIVTD